MNHSKKIQEFILELINSSLIGEMLPTEKQIAEQFGVSRSTVQNVMLTLCREGFLERKKGRGTFVASKERLILSNEKSSYKGQIFYVYPDYPSLDLLLFRKLVEKQALERQLNMVEVRISRYSNYELVRQLANKAEHLKGIVMFPCSEMKKEDIQIFQSIGVPIAMFGGASVHDLIYTINPDYQKMGYCAVKQFIKAGHRVLACVLNEPSSTDDKLLITGMKKALKDSGLSSKTLIVSTKVTKRWEDSALTGYLETNKLLELQERPSAIFYKSAVGALAGLRAISEVGLCVPRDISIIAGSSLYEPLNEYLFPRIGNITCRPEIAVKVALNVITSPETIHSNNVVIDVDVNLQESVAPNQEIYCENKL